MSVFRNYNSKQAGDVNANAHPNVHSYPWIPSQRNVRDNPGIRSQPQRIQPHERGTFFPTSASAGGTLAPSMASGTCGCGGACGNGSQNLSSTPPTPSEMATTHALPGGNVHGTVARPVMGLRPQPRTTGALRSGLRPGGKPALMAMPYLGGRGTR